MLVLEWRRELYLNPYLASRGRSAVDQKALWPHKLPRYPIGMRGQGLQGTIILDAGPSRITKQKCRASRSQLKASVGGKLGGNTP